MRCLVTGGKGFIGSHLVDMLVLAGHEVTIVDNLISGLESNTQNGLWINADIRDYHAIAPLFAGIDWVFHTAAVARTPWAIEDPLTCNDINVTGSLNVLQAAREAGAKRVVLSSSNIVYAAETPYKASKLAMEMYAKTYSELYGLSTICLRYSNVYGTRQREDVSGPNVFAALRKSKREDGFLRLTGDGEQTRCYTHVSDIVRANMMAAESLNCGEIDICTGVYTSLNEVAGYFDCPIQYVDERVGDIKHIPQNAAQAVAALNFRTLVKLEDRISDVL